MLKEGEILMQKSKKPVSKPSMTSKMTHNSANATSGNAKATAGSSMNNSRATSGNAKATAGSSMNNSSATSGNAKAKSGNTSATKGNAKAKSKHIVNCTASKACKTGSRPTKK